MLPPGLFVPLAVAVRNAVDVPVIAVGKLGDPVLAERTLQQGKANFIALGSPRAGVHIKAYNYLPLREKLIECGVQLYSDSQVVEIRNNGVTVASSHELLFLKADTVVLAVGAKPANRLVKEPEGAVPNYIQLGIVWSHEVLWRP